MEVRDRWDVCLRRDSIPWFTYNLNLFRPRRFMGIVDGFIESSFEQLVSSPVVLFSASC